MKIEKICCGCGACANVCPTHCIEMIYDDEGFIMPKINEEKCVHCDKCIGVCPLYSDSNEIEIPRVIAAYCKDDSIRYKSSSGGVFTVLASEVLRNNGIVCGVYFDSEKQIAAHTIVENEKDLDFLRGSKYIQSETNDIYRRVEMVLREGRQILFSGTPCQIAALRSYVGTEYDNLLCVEVICHGVPSTLLWKKYIEFVESKSKKRIKNILFRSKKYSWNNFGIEKEFNDAKKVFRFSFEDPYFRFFNTNLCLRTSCYHCQFKGLNTRADISLGDFWNIDKIDRHLDDGKGLSLVSLNTEKGRKFFDSVVSSLCIVHPSIDYYLACDCNHAIDRSMSESNHREEFLMDLKVDSFKFLFKKYSPLKMKYIIKGIVFRTKIGRMCVCGGVNNNQNYGILYELE